ncbi:MAG: hypothetical protein U9N81_00730 [Bacillota bacterium]|nr:hypothetical protein [Bacillota bacterium]
MDNKELVEKLKAMFPSGKISCTEARRATEELDIKLGDMGELCDEAKLKIHSCELGCF